MPQKSIIMALIDKILNDTNRDFRVFIFRLITIGAIALGVFAYTYRAELISLYNKSSISSYTEMIKQTNETKFKDTAKEQLVVIHMITKSDFSTVLAFTPRNVNNFVEMISTEGRMPMEIIQYKNYSYAVNSTSEEYKNHIYGKSFLGDKSAYLPKFKDLPYVYSCPYFNMDNTYSGTISVFWKDPSNIPKENLDIICQQSARLLGRIR